MTAGRTIHKAQKPHNDAPKFNIANIPARRPFGRRRKVCPFSGEDCAEDRLQGREAAAALHLAKRARSSRRASPPFPPRSNANSRRAIKLRPLTRAAAVRRSIGGPTDASHSARTRRESRRHRRRGESARRVRAQLPAAAQQGAARRPKTSRKVFEGATRRNRSAQRRCARQRRKGVRQARRQDLRAASAKRAKAASFTARSRPATWPRDRQARRQDPIERNAVVLDKPIKTLGVHPTCACGCTRKCRSR